MKITPHVNHGRWIVQCPDCGNWFEVKPDREIEFVCALCFRELQAVIYVPIDKADFGKGFRPIPDAATRSHGMMQAKAAGKSYPIEYPADHEIIMHILRKRKTENMNWELGETAEDLRKENEAHGIM